jgi:hypothetical protein
LETKEQKDRLIIEQEIVRSRIMMIFESQENIQNWENLSENPAIFILDTNAMRKQIDNGFAEELIASALHPRHFKRNIELYNYDISIDEYIN